MRKCRIRNFHGKIKGLKFTIQNFMGGKGRGIWVFSCENLRSNFSGKDSGLINKFS